MRPYVHTLLLAFVLLAYGCRSPVHAPPTVRVLSFNLWHGGDAGGVGAGGVAEVVRASGADLIGVQEAHGVAGRNGERPDRSLELAHELGFEHRALSGRRAILSRWPIEETTRGGNGVIVRAPSGALAIFCVHFAAAPYQPYQLLGIEYFGGEFLSTAEEAVSAARAARGSQVDALLSDIADLVVTCPVIVTGDFNEPSHLDWTARAAAAGSTPIAVEWPATRALQSAGFVDAYRATLPDEVQHPGHTWTPITEPGDPTDRHDRIDFVFVRGAAVVAAHVVGERADRADIVVAPFPSDHRAVAATVAIEPTEN